MSRARTIAARRGSAYVLVLSIAMLITVLGLGAVAVSRVSAQAVVAANDWETAGTLAFSATEHAISALNAAAAVSPSGWRAAYASGQAAFTQAVGRGTMSWTLKDETDGNLSADYLRAFRVYGVGKCGRVTRVYSVQVLPGGTALPLLRSALYASASVSLTGNTQAVNGPISGSGTVAVTAGTTGSVEAATTTGSAPNATITTGVAAKVLPSATLFNDLLATATTIDFAGLTAGGSNNGKLQKCLLSPASNPYGATNPNGLYAIVIPSGGSLTIANVRLVGTLLISATNNNNVTITGPNLMDPASANYPTLMVSGTKFSVTMSGSNTWLTESGAGTNLNPPSTPYQGASDSDTSDDFPPQYHGVFHFVGDGTSNVMLNSNAYFIGTVIATCPTKTANQTTLLQDPAVYANPPMGYATGDTLLEVPGSWHWDAPP